MRLAGINVGDTVGGLMCGESGEGSLGDYAAGLLVCTRCYYRSGEYCVENRGHATPAPEFD